YTRAAEQHLRQGQWPYQVLGLELHGLVLGLIGLGSIGSRVARLARAFDMKVMATTARQDPIRANRLRVRQVNLDELIRTADVISLHATLANEMRPLLGANELARVKPGAILINTARAGLVDTSAL